MEQSTIAVSPIWKVILAAFATSLTAIVISIAANSAVYMTQMHKGAWLHDHNIVYFIGNQLFEVPAGLFVHILLLEGSYLAGLVVAMYTVPKKVIEKRCFSFVFLTFFLYCLFSLLFYIHWYPQFYWYGALKDFIYCLFMLPLPGAINYAVWLLVGYSIARRRLIVPWDKLPWWSVFAPTVSFFATLCLSEIIHHPICWILYGTWM